MSCSLSSGRNIEWPRFSKLRLLRRPNFSPNFSPPSFHWVLLVAWPPAEAPEAEHRCTRQPPSATIPWSSGSWRRRRLWTRRTKTAMASEGDIWGGNFMMTWDSVVRKWMKTNVEVDEMLMVQVFCQILFSDVFNFCGENQPKNICTNIWSFFLPARFLHPFLLQCKDKTCSNDDFSLAIFRICWWFKCFVDFVYHFFWKMCQRAKTFAPTFSVVLCDQDGVDAYTSIICFVETGSNKDFWVGLCSWVGVYVLVYYPWRLDCQKAKGNSFFNQLDVIKTSQKHNVP